MARPTEGRTFLPGEASGAFCATAFFEEWSSSSSKTNNGLWPLVILIIIFISALTLLPLKNWKIIWYSLIVSVCFNYKYEITHPCLSELPVATMTLIAGGWSLWKKATDHLAFYQIIIRGRKNQEKTSDPQFCHMAPPPRQQSRIKEVSGLLKVWWWQSQVSRSQLTICWKKKLEVQ